MGPCTPSPISIVVVRAEGEGVRVKSWRVMYAEEVGVVVKSVGAFEGGLETRTSRWVPVMNFRAWREGWEEM